MLRKKIPHSENFQILKALFVIDCNVLLCSILLLYISLYVFKLDLVS